MSNESGNKKGAQVTIQVCLEQSVFLARFREMQLESETMVLPEKAGLSPRGDLRIRSMIVSNVIKILQQRKAAIESDLRKMNASAESEEEKQARRESAYCHCGMCRLMRLRNGELERL